MRIVVLTSGGDAPGMNAAIRVLAETERLLDGTSPVTAGRLALLEMADGLLAL